MWTWGDDTYGQLGPGLVGAAAQEARRLEGGIGGGGAGGSARSGGGGGPWGHGGADGGGGHGGHGNASSPPPAVAFVRTRPTLVASFGCTCR